MLNVHAGDSFNQEVLTILFCICVCVVFIINESLRADSAIISRAHNHRSNYTKVGGAGLRKIENQDDADQGIVCRRSGPTQAPVARQGRQLPLSGAPLHMGQHTRAKDPQCMGP